MTATPLRCIMVGVRNKSRGGMLVHLFRNRPEQFRIVALVDATADIAKESAQEYGWDDMPCFGSLEDALDRIQAEACVINSPARFHTDQIETGLQAGLHVFCAKPMTYDLTAAEHLVALAEDKNRCLLIDQQWQFSLTQRTLAQWVRDRKFGLPGFVEMRVHRHRPQMRAFTGDNPFIWEQGVHSFNSLLAILGRPAVSVQSFQTKPSWSEYNGPTVAMGEIEFEGSVPCHYIGTFDSRVMTLELRIEFEQAAVRVWAENSWNNRIEVARPGKNFEPMDIVDEQDKQPNERFNIDHFHEGCQASRTGDIPQLVNDGRDNLRTLAVVDAFIRSAHTGCRESVRQYPADA